MSFKSLRFVAQTRLFWQVHSMKLELGIIHDFVGSLLKIVLALEKDNKERE